MAPKKKAGGQKRSNETDLAELERLRKQVAEQEKALKAEQARKEEESQGKRPVNSRRQRTLVRWDVDTDLRLLLAMQYACNKEGVKIPWKDVAEAMGEKFTEGAIVQHLSKLRTKRDEQEKPNPPPLKRAANGYHKNNKNNTNNKKELPSPTEESGPITRSKKRRRGNPSNEASEDDVYTLKEKQFAKNKKKDKVFTAPKLRTKREDTDSDDSQKLVCVGAEWLDEFTGDDDHEGNKASESSEESSTESTQATPQAAKKSKMVTLKMNKERLASVDRNLGGSATFRESVTPTNPPHVLINNMPSSHASYLLYPPSDSVPHFPSMTPFSTNAGFSVAFPSNGPSPFDIVNRAPSTINDTFPGTEAYARFENPLLAFPESYNGQDMMPVAGYTETSGFENQFIPESELFVSLPDVEPPRYLGYDGEDTKEF
ncbi:uncharacterized protein N7479_003916 [Penicillium vulpinum]|uniref:Myb-like domain-containing protein n=1 Tax=Penicillium vulpinum TaxID=29845 RepID=A0A1V6RH48_9EURO|nr:uncharacterized protein N7479_003916 [Penicillium vulpinum]KAJ5964040.1 hypothetical protein N7479_003916 [Penicillium vulpinum]OQE00828.1 hypothetical protein PENVUL_c045G02325 [Penicillium vulpinum]